MRIGEARLDRSDARGLGQPAEMRGELRQIGRDAVDQLRRFIAPGENGALDQTFQRRVFVESGP